MEELNKVLNKENSEGQIQESKTEISKSEIETKVDEWVITHLNNFTFRKYQKEYIIDIIYSILSGKHLNIIEAPTGSGKSIMVIIMAGVLFDYYKKTSYILCSDLYLWEQYSKAIEYYRLADFGKIKGLRGNYICNETDEDLDVAPCRLAMIPFASLFNKEWAIKNGWDCAVYCKYMRERKKAIYAGVTLMTYQLWFNYMCDSEIKAEAPFKARDIIFCDECHKAPGLCQEYRQIEIFEHSELNRMTELLTFCKETNFCLDHVEFMKNVNIEAFVNDVKKVIEKIYSIPKENQEELLGALCEYQEYLQMYPCQCYQAMKTLYGDLANERGGQKAHLSKKEHKMYNIAKYYDARQCNIKHYIDMVLYGTIEEEKYQENIEPQYKYIVKSDNRYRDPSTGKMVWPDDPMATYKFAKEDLLTYYTLLCHQPYTVMLSATVGGHHAFDDNIGTRHTEDKKSIMFRIPSTFDFSKSPIYYIPGNKMSREHIGESLPANAAIINRILKSPKHANEKGIIHTGSYKNAWDLKNMLDPEVQKRIFIYSESKEKQDIIKRYEKSDNGVLIGPTLTEGIDLPDDGCRFIIILKVPYPYLGDELVKAKVSLFPKWYNSETSNAIIQGVGRGNRHPNDWSTTYILDGSFAKLYGETREQYAPEFRERIKLLNS